MKFFTPIFSSENGLFVPIDDVLVSKTKEEAIEKGILASSYLGFIDLNFTGDILELTDNTEYFLVSIPDEERNSRTELALIGGPMFEQLKAGKEVEGVTKTSLYSFKNNAFIVEKMKVKDSTIIIGIGIDDATQRPYVILNIGDNESILNPEEAKRLSVDLFRAALYSEIDAFHNIAMAETFEDVNDQKRAQYIDSLRRARQDYMESYDAEAEEQLTEDEEAVRKLQEALITASKENNTE